MQIEWQKREAIQEKHIHYVPLKLILDPIGHREKEQ